MSPTYRLTLTHSGQAAGQEPRVTDCADLNDARTLARELIGRACAETPAAADRAARASYRDALLRTVDDMPAHGARFILPNGSAVEIEATHPFLVPVVFAFADTDAESAHDAIVQMLKDDARVQFVGGALTAMRSTLDDPDLDVTVKECGDEAATAPRWQLIDRWIESGANYGDNAMNGDACVSLYRAGGERIEFAYFPDALDIDDSATLYRVGSCVSSWTCDMHGEEDRGRDQEERKYDFEDPDEQPPTSLDEAQARAARENARDLSRVYI